MSEHVVHNAGSADPDNAREAVAKYIELPGGLAVEIEQLCHRCGCHAVSILAAAWKVMQYRITGHERVSIGVESADGRAITVESDLTDVTFETLVMHLCGTLSATWPALASPGAADRFPDLVMGCNVTSGQDRGLRVSCGAGGGKIQISIDPGLTSYSSVTRLTERFLLILAGAAADPMQRPEDLMLLLPDEYEQIVRRWNETASEVAFDHTVHGLVTEWGAGRPEALALVSGTERLTYGELNKRANRLAHYLIRHGIRPEVRVGVCLDRSPCWVVALLAVLKAGAVYVPLDPAYPVERQMYMLRDAGAPILLTRCDAPHAAPAGVKVICLDTDEKAISREDSTEPAVFTDPDQLMYVLYTSGSTGHPKGVAVGHRSFVNLIHWHRRVFGITPGEHVAQVAGPAFDASGWELWSHLAAGATIYIPDAEVRITPQLLRDWLVDNRISVTFAPTPLAERLLALAWPDEVPLRILLVGGEALRVFPPENLPFAVVNIYGPTEATVITTWGYVSQNTTRTTLPTIGRPIDNATVYLLDGNMRAVPPGVPGELYIGGSGLAQGYQGKPDLTAARFIPDPFGGEPGARLYRTGDLARYTPDGEIEFLGRVDGQVKLRGFRIELDEVAAAFHRVEGVQQATVLLREDRPGEPHLVAYVVPDERRALTGAGLRAALKDWLPEYMVPSDFVLLSALPLTPNGKVDKRALPAAASTAAAAEEAFFHQPRTPSQEILCDIVAGVLNLDRVGIHDDFFAAGGHSLLAAQVMARVRAVTGVNLPSSALFSAPTVALLARQVEVQRQEKADSTVPPVLPVSRDEPLPLLHGQLGMWMLHKLYPGSPMFNEAFALRLTGPLDADALRRSLEQIAERHESLRTAFVAPDGEPVQQICSVCTVPMPMVDVSHMPNPEAEACLAELAEADASRPFDLSAAPLLRCTLVRLHASEYVLLLTMHHVVCDGWSMGVLMEDLCRLYEDNRMGRSAPSLASLPVQCADAAIWQRRWLQGEELQSHLRYWRERLAGAPTMLELPSDRPRPPVRSGKGRYYRFRVDGELTNAVRKLSREQGATIFMTLFATFNVLLHRYTGEDEILVGTPAANRPRPEMERMIGCFVNMVALRTNLAGNPCFTDLLSQVRASALAAYDHQGMPFDQLVSELQVGRDPSRTPLFQVAFVLQNAPMPEGRIGDLKASLTEVHTGTAKFDLAVFLTETKEGLDGAVEYSTDLFDEPTVARLVEHFTTLLKAVAREPGALVGDLPMLTDAERRTVVETWNETDTTFPADRCIHELFESIAMQAPDRVAVTAEGRSLTYCELNARANQVAHLLRSAGVGSHTRVGVSMERSAELVAALLGILKAGGAYVPLDPTYPRERLAYMMQDARITVLLTQQRLSEQLPRPGVQVFCLDTDWPAPVPESDRNPEIQMGSENPAYVIYTSGSTGKPKGVCVSHRNVIRLVRETDYARFGPDEVYLQLAPVAFDASTFEIWGCLLNGGRLVLMPPGMPSLEELGEVVRRQGVTTLWLTAGLFHQMAEEHLGSLTQVRQLLAGGDVLSVPHVQKAAAALRQGRVINGYGPTECTTFACCYHVTESERLSRSVPIGRPIANTRVYILDRWLNPAPVGVPGELYIGGEGVALGYFERPDLTAERFVPDPFGPVTGARLYRTGDLARFTRDGNIEFLGRLDGQVKVRGFRIEPGEIEAVLATHPQVREAVVAVREDQPGDKRLVAYVVSDGEAAPDLGQLRAWLRERLPEYMIPAAFVVLASLPITTNGKVDRSALPAPDLQQAVREHFTPAVDEVEQIIAAVWQEVLRLERVSVEHNFFDIGGTSLSLTQVYSRLKERLSFPVTMVDLFRFPTVRRLAVHLRDQEPTGAAVTDARELASRQRAAFMRHRQAEKRVRSGD